MLLKVIVALVSLWLIWGSTFLATKIAIITIPPLLMVGACFLIAGLIIFSWSRIRSGRNSNSDPAQITYKHKWKTAFLAGSAMIFGGQGGIVWGEQYVSSGIAALLFSTVSIWIVLIGAIAFRQPFTKTVLLGTSIGFGGLILFFSSYAQNINVSVSGISAVLIGSFSLCLIQLYVHSHLHYPISE